MTTTTNTNLTAETITTSQIRRLRTEAAEAGDTIQVEICDLALAPHETANDGGSPLIGPAGGSITRTSCRQHCADAINNARAQDEVQP